MHRPIFQGVITALDEILQHKRPAHRVVDASFKQNRKWGSRDRRQFAETVYDLVRGWRGYLWRAGHDWPTDDQMPVLTPEEVGKVIGIYLGEGTAREGFEEQARAVRLSFPNWLDDICAADRPDWEKMAPVLNGIAPVFLRTNRAKIEPQQLAQRLSQSGRIVQAVGDDAVLLNERANLFLSPEFKQGLFEVQDLNSQKIAPFVGAQPGERIIDACAGAGGKTLHLAALMKGRGKIVAMDIHNHKLEELKVRARRNDAQIIETRLIESSKTIKRLDQSADRVLLDVPCSGLGVLRRHCDYKWSLTKDQLAELRALQAQLFSDYSRMVKVNGTLVYATCSILRQENQDQVQSFLKSQGDRFQLEQELDLLPQFDGGDGFYAARLKRLS